MEGEVPGGNKFQTRLWITICSMLGGLALIVGLVLSDAHCFSQRSSPEKERTAKEETLAPGAGDHSITGKLTCDEPVHEFGVRRAGTTVKHAFMVSNVGRTDFKIRKIRSTCGCTATVNDKSLLRPGQNTTIHVEVHLGSIGAKSVSIYVVGDSGISLRMKVVGEVVGDVVAVDQTQEISLDFGDIEHSKEARRYLRLSNPELDSWRLSEIPSQFAVNAERISEQYLRLAVTPKTSMDIGPFSAQLQIMIHRVNTVERIPLTINGTVISDLFARPATVDLSKTESNSAYVIVRSSIERPFRITDIESPQGIRVVGANKTKLQKTHRLRIVRTENSEQRKHKHVVRVLSECPERFVAIRCRYK